LVAVVVVYALLCYQIVTAKTVDTPGTNEVLPTSSSIHHMQGSGGGPSWSFKVNQPSARGESKLIELRDDTAHFTIKTFMAANQQRRMATVGIHLPKLGGLVIVRPGANCGSSRPKLPNRNRKMKPVSIMMFGAPCRPAR